MKNIGEIEKILDLPIKKIYDQIKDFISEQFNSNFDNRKNTPKPLDIPNGYNNRYNYYIPLIVANIGQFESVVKKNQIDIIFSNLLTQEFKTPINMFFEQEIDFDPCYKFITHYANITIMV